MKDKIKEIMSLINAQVKAEAIIESCINSDHCATARRYIDLFYQKYKDIDAYQFLMKVYLDKMLEV